MQVNLFKHYKTKKDNTMKNMLLLLICVVSTSLLAQPPHKHGHHKHGHHHKPKLSKEAKTELKQYHDEKIYPVKKAVHDDFDSKLSAADLSFLKQKRGEAKAMHEEAKAFYSTMKEKKKGGADKEDLMIEGMEFKLEMMKKKKAFGESMKPFMERNKDLIKTSMEQLKEKHETWKKEKHAIITKHATPEQKEKMEKHRKEYKDKCDKQGEKYAKKKAEHKADHEKHAAIKFVLWDGEKREMPEDKDIHSNRLGDIEKPAGIDISNYPNPAINQTTIIITTKEAVKNAVLTITDAQGKQVFKKQFNKLEAGEEQVDISLKKFSAGQYFYTIETGETQLTKTLVVNK